MQPQAEMDFTLFVGPPTCFYHNCGMQQGNGRTAAFIPTDVQMSLGLVEELTVQAVGEVLAANPWVKSIALFTACQTAFAGIDMQGIARNVQREYGILCIHRQNCRILMPAPGRARGGEQGGQLRRRDGSNTISQLLDRMPKEADVPGIGLLLMNGNAKLAPHNELYSAARQWGFDWVQSMAEWRSLDALALARNASLIVVSGEQQLSVAQEMEERWNIPYLYLPNTCSIADVDGYYDAISSFMGRGVDVRDARDAAIEAVDWLAQVAYGREIELAGPACGVELLQQLGANATLAEPWGPMGPGSRGPRPGGPGPRGPRPDGQCPDDPEGSAPKRPPSRSGDDHYPTSGPGMRRGPGNGPRPPRPPMPRQDLPQRSSLWGYCAIEDFARRMTEELM